MNSWRNVGFVETIYEDEYEYKSSRYTSSLTPSPSSPPIFTLQSRVEAWSLEKGCKTDVIIRVQGKCFHLHKDPLTSRSTYLKCQLARHSDLTLSPPLNITAETFSIVADFCYGAHIIITPFNVSALRITVEMLEMTNSKGSNDEDLKQVTEAYFRRIITLNKEYTIIIFRSSLSLLPEAETTAFLISRCIEALSLTNREGHSNGVVNLIDDVVDLRIEDFKIVTESMHLRFTTHDVIYQIVDLYLKEHEGELAEEQKMQICNCIDCNKLSSKLLLHAVQNPRMPLRFIIRAMLAEQLNTRRCFFPTDDHNNHSQQHPHLPRHLNTMDDDPITLGAILQRDAALREAAQLKEAMTATNLRIKSLEDELNGMRKILNQSEKERKVICELNKMKERSVLESGRSASFHYGKENSKIERGERGSVSNLNIRLSSGEENSRRFSQLPSEDQSTPRIKKNKNIRQRLIYGLKTAFGVSKQSSGNNISKVDGRKVRVGDEEDENHEEFVVIEDDDLAYLQRGTRFLP